MMKKRESFIEATGNSPRNSSNDKLEKLLGIHERSLVMGKRNFKIVKKKKEILAYLLSFFFLF